MLPKLSLNYKYIKKVFLIFLVLLFMISGMRFIYDIIDQRGFFGIGLPSKMKIFTSQIGDYSILYPESWTASETPNGNHGDIYTVAMISPFRAIPSLDVAIKLFPDENINQVARWGETRIYLLPEYKEGKTSQFATNNIKGISRMYEWQKDILFSKTVTMLCIDNYTLVEEKGYILQFCAEKSQWPSVEPIFQQMLDSFQTR